MWFRSDQVGDGRRRDEHEQDDQLHPGGSHDEELEPEQAEGRGRCNGTNNDATKNAGSSSMSSYGGGNAGEERQGEHGQREEQPAQRDDGRKRCENGEDDHGGGLRKLGRTVAPATTTKDAICSITGAARGAITAPCVRW